MEKAILKTLIYADIFDYPLKARELHRWLIGPPAGRAGKKATLRQLEKALRKLNHESRIMNHGGYYFFERKDGLIGKRIRKEKQSAIYFGKAKIIAQILKIIPWIKLVGISGGLAMNNASKKDDIDLFIITGKNRLWISRLFCLGVLSAIRQRRKVGDKGKKFAGKICLNILLEEDKLEQKNKDIFVAHEVLQMKVLWQRNGIYSKYLADNDWVFRFLPNWVAIGITNYELRIMGKNHNSLFMLHNSFVNLLENLAKWFQLKIMSKPQGLERIEDGALYFHPQDCREKVLKIYKKKLATLDN